MAAGTGTPWRRWWWRRGYQILTRRYICAHISWPQTTAKKKEGKTERKKVGNIKDANARTKLSWWAFSKGMGAWFEESGHKKKGPQKCVRLRAIEMAEMRLQIVHIHRKNIKKISIEKNIKWIKLK